MGKVTVVIQSEDESTSDIHKMAQYILSPDTPVAPDNMEKTLDCYDVFIVPDDDEFPDLS